MYMKKDLRLTTLEIGVFASWTDDINNVELFLVLFHLCNLIFLSVVCVAYMVFNAAYNHVWRKF